MDPVPLVWHKADNKGLCPDVRHNARYSYEVALYGRDGDVQLAKGAIPNLFASRTTRLNHPTEKPQAVLAHFFRLFVDGRTRMLDPTCGGGTSIKAAREAGAQYALGIELNKTYHRNARLNCGLAVAEGECRECTHFSLRQPDDAQGDCAFFAKRIGRSYRGCPEWTP